MTAFALVCDRFESVLGSRRGGGLRATVPDEEPGAWFQYLITDRPRSGAQGTWAAARAAALRRAGGFRPPIYRERAHAEDGATALKRRFPFYETELRWVAECWAVFYRKRPGY